MIKKLKPLFILLGAFAISYLLWLLGQVQPDPVEEAPAPDVIVEILTPKDFQIQMQKLIVHLSFQVSFVNPAYPLLLIRLYIQ